MDVIDQLRLLATRIANTKDMIQTEEATKNAMVMPFIQILGYNPFDPLEVTPELIADYVCELFLDNNKEKLEGLLSCEDTLDNVYSLIYDNPACDELLEEFYTLENDYQANCDDVVYIEIRAVYKDSEQWRNELKEDSVTFSIGFNFDSYGREEYIKDCYSITLPVHDLDTNVITRVFLDMDKAL